MRLDLCVARIDGEARWKYRNCTLERILKLPHRREVKLARLQEVQEPLCLKVPPERFDQVEFLIADDAHGDYCAG